MKRTSRMQHRQTSPLVGGPLDLAAVVDESDLLRMVGFSGGPLVTGGLERPLGGGPLLYGVVGGGCRVEWENDDVCSMGEQHRERRKHAWGGTA